MSFFLNKLLGQPAQASQTGSQLPSPVPAAVPAFAPVKPTLPQPGSYPMAKQNPFMVAMDRDSEAFQNTYGINQPMKKPMFLGYKDNKALYGGSRLFILY